MPRVAMPGNPPVIPLCQRGIFLSLLLPLSEKEGQGEIFGLDGVEMHSTPADRT